MVAALNFFRKIDLTSSAWQLFPPQVIRDAQSYQLCANYSFSRPGNFPWSGMLVNKLLNVCNGILQMGWSTAKSDVHRKWKYFLLVETENGSYYVAIAFIMIYVMVLTFNLRQECIFILVLKKMSNEIKKNWISKNDYQITFPSMTTESSGGGEMNIRTLP